MKTMDKEKAMIVAFSVQGEKIGPWGDSSHQLWIIDIIEHQPIHRRQYWLEEASAKAQIKKLKDLRVAIFICEEISQPLLLLMQQAHIHVIPKIQGNIGEALRAFCDGDMAKLVNAPTPPPQKT